MSREGVRVSNVYAVSGALQSAGVRLLERLEISRVPSPSRTSLTWT